MNVQVLVASMHQNDHSLLKKMNIQSNVIVGNQCDFDSIERFKFENYDVMYLNFNEKGVGLNRNNALMRAKDDICLFADDDIIYVDNYPEIIIKAFNENPSADIIVFNLIEKNSLRKQIKRKCKVNRLNYLRYGTARIAVRLKAIKENGIFFNQCFGGGCEHSHGEDNLFLTACLDKGLKIVALPIDLAELTDVRKSTWNNGYDDKYIIDQGYLYRAISKKWWKLLCLQDAIRRHKSYGLSVFNSYKKMTRLKK